MNYFRKLTQLRKDNLVLVYGKYTLLDKNNPSVYAYTRDLNGKKVLVMLNFTGKTAAVSTPYGASTANLLLCNYADNAKTVKSELRPYEAVVYQLN